MGHTKIASHVTIAAALGAGLWSMSTVAAAAADATPAVSWSGAYVGLMTGLSDGQNDWKATSVGINNFAGVAPGSAKASLDKMGGRLGAYGGWNFPIDANLVAGVEGDFAGILGSKKTASGIPGVDYSALSSLNGTGGLPDDSISARQNWDASLRARLGYAVDPSFLVYGTGGVAFQDSEYKANCPATAMSFCGVPESERITKTSVGWTLGAGAEAKLTETLAVRLEYRYAAFGSQNLNFFQSNNGGFDAISAKVDPSAHIISVGVSYQFGGL